MGIGALVWVTADSLTGITLGAGFALDIVAGVFAIVGGVFMCISPADE